MEIINRCRKLQELHRPMLVVGGADVIWKYNSPAWDTIVRKIALNGRNTDTPTISGEDYLKRLQLKSRDAHAIKACTTKAYTWKCSTPSATQRSPLYLTGQSESKGIVNSWKASPPPTRLHSRRHGKTRLMHLPRQNERRQDRRATNPTRNRLFSPSGRRRLQGDRLQEPSGRRHHPRNRK